ncbi:MAG TPA: ATP-binding protein, partial [Ktedonobacteraceae bacterium]|nr:ATP-binding protein [Ktedonobacteraceae bacterium]
MNWTRPNWGFLHRGRSLLSREAGAGLFSGLRLRLTLWYCGVLGTALVLFGLILFFSAQYFLLHPIESDTQFHARGHSNEWSQGAVDRACPLSTSQNPFGLPPGQGQGFFMSELEICFNNNGSLLSGENTIGLPAVFVTNSLVQSALQKGYASDTVNAGGSIGEIYRYALAVPDPSGHGYQGVVVTGESVQAQMDALNLLMILLLSVGGVALLGAGVGGLFLSNRALAPARLAWTNQQRFIADAAHELRTPLTLLRADSEVLLRGRKKLQPDDAMLLEDIVAETNHMSNIATNLLTLARLDNNAVHREHEVVNLAELARKAARRIAALADEKHISVQLESEGVPTVIGDPMLLEQALLILLDNAVKYNRQDGRILVRTEEHDHQARLEVRDTGIGIAAEHLPHMGERFYRVDKARSREAGGTGLGLSIARSIATTHGGQLALTSVPDQGTTVTMTLPLVHGTITDLPSVEEQLQT